MELWHIYMVLIILILSKVNIAIPCTLLIFWLLLRSIKRHNVITCRKPTYDNPMMNSLLMSDDMEMEACKNEDTDKYLLYGVYEDSKVLYRNKGLKRRFITLPVTRYPTNSKQLGEQLYNPGEGCKTTNTNCKTYRDVRFSR
jgi:hypothetical protein